ncbi:hypothetical protein QOT17_008679 [Balamuthia mandrillaris]
MDIEGFTTTKGLGFKPAEAITLCLKDKNPFHTSKVVYCGDTKLCTIKAHSFLGSTPDFQLLAATRGKQCLLYAKGNKAKTSFEWKVTAGKKNGLCCATIKAKRASRYSPLAYNVQVELAEDFKDGITHVEKVSCYSQTFFFKRTGNKVARLILKKCSSFTGRRTYEVFAKRGEHLGLVLVLCSLIDWLRRVSASYNETSDSTSSSSSDGGSSVAAYSGCSVVLSCDGGGGGICGC